MASVTTYLQRKLKLLVNETKSTVDRPWNRSFLGFTFTKRRPNRRKTNQKAIIRFKEEIRLITSRTRGVTLKTVIHDLAGYISGWKLYYGFSEAKVCIPGTRFMGAPPLALLPLETVGEGRVSPFGRKGCNS